MAVVLMAALAVGVSAYTGVFRICGPQILTVANHLVRARLCDPLSLADLAPLWVLAVVLLWPDIKSLSLFGLGVEKRELERDLTALASLTSAAKVSQSLDEKAQAERPTAPSETMEGDKPS